MTFGRWLFNIAIAADTLLNSIAWGKKHEPVSKRFARARLKGKWWGCWGCRALSWFFRTKPGAPDHCDEALLWDA